MTKLNGEGLFEMGNDGDLATEEEEVFSMLATDAAAPTVRGK